MSNKTIETPATDVCQTPNRGLNSRGEEYFEGVRQYQCRSESCMERGELLELSWDDSLTHTNSSVSGPGWSVQVEWWPQEQAWRVYGELTDSTTPFGTWLDKTQTDAFHDALTAAYARADDLNRADQPEHPNLAFMVECADSVTAHIPHNGTQTGKALVWLTKHPHLQQVPVEELYAALRVGEIAGTFGAVAS